MYLRLILLAWRFSSFCENSLHPPASHCVALCSGCYWTWPCEQVILHVEMRRLQQICAVKSVQWIQSSQETERRMRWIASRGSLSRLSALLRADKIQVVIIQSFRPSFIFMKCMIGYESTEWTSNYSSGRSSFRCTDPSQLRRHLTPADHQKTECEQV